jgi:hypothetical protein
MSRWTFLIGHGNRAKLHAWIERAPLGMIVEFRESKRTTEQNAKLWPMLTDVSLQLTWHGQTYPPEDWKDFFMHQLRGGRWMPAEEGGLVPVGFRTSELTKAEFSDLIEVIYAFGARHGVEWTDPAEKKPPQGPEDHSQRRDAAGPNKPSAAAA